MVFADPGPDERRLAEAAAWRVRLAEAEQESSEAFEAWLAADDANLAAWAAVEGGWREIGEAAAAPELLALRRDALDRARRQARSRWGGPVLTRRAAAGGAVAVAVGLAVAALWAADRPDVYQTRLGERRVVTLEDGSRVALDSATRLTVRLTRQARTLDLVAGQARFDVAKDVTRPFSVQAGRQTVVATGTSFSIDRLGDRVLVTLIEGRVTVIGAPPRRGIAAKPSASVELEAGERLVAADQAGAAPPTVEKVGLDKATAWESGQLIFDDEPLSAVAERVSRYTQSPVVVKDAGVGALRISGVFTAGDLATFVDTVTQYLPVRAEKGPDGATELRSRG